MQLIRNCSDFGFWRILQGIYQFCRPYIWNVCPQLSETIEYFGGDYRLAGSCLTDLHLEVVQLWLC